MSDSITRLKRPFRAPFQGSSSNQTRRVSTNTIQTSDSDMTVKTTTTNPLPPPSIPDVSLNAELAFDCLWRREQFRKHKTWDGDGVIMVMENRLVLSDVETGKQLTSMYFVVRPDLSSDQVFKIGSFEVQIEGQVSSNNKPISAPPQPHKINNNNQNSIRPSQQTSGAPSNSTPRSGFRPPSIRPRPLQEIQSESSNHIQASKKARTDSNDNDDDIIVLQNTEKKQSALPVVTKPRNSFRSPLPAANKNQTTTDVSDQILFPKPEGGDQNGQKVVTNVVLDPLLAQHFRPHQISGVKFMYQCVMGMLREGTGCILADEMGLGKTAQTIALIWTLLKQNPYSTNQSVIQRALVVCPASLISNWVSEFNKWLGKDRIRVFGADQLSDIKNFGLSPAIKVLIVNYEKIRSVVDDLNSAQPPFGLMICDEGHRLKTQGGKTLNALKSLKTKRRIILSGTPIQNNMSEFHTMADFVLPGCFDTYNNFKQFFEVPILRSRERHCPAEQKATGKARSELLLQITRSFVLRRTSELLSKHLPPKREYVIFCKPTEFQVDIYKQILNSNEYRSLDANGFNDSQHLVVMSVLRKLCNSPGLLKKNMQEANDATNGFLDKVVDCNLRELNPNSMQISGKLVVLQNLLSKIRQTSDEKVVIVSNFTKTLDIIETYCNTKNYTYFRLDGTTATSKRTEMVKKFNATSQKDNFIFLLSSKAGGTGLNIVGSSRLILFDADWNPANDLQAMGRVHRDGQKRETHIYRLVTCGTIDEKIFQRQIMKTGLSKSLMDANGSGKGGKNTFTAEDLRDIFSFQPDTISNTHDIVGCPNCDGFEGLAPPSSSISQNDDDDYTKSPPPKFMKATQVAERKAEELMRSKEKLSQLLEWKTVHCDDPNETSTLPDKTLIALTSQTQNDIQTNTAGNISFIFHR